MDYRGFFERLFEGLGALDRRWLYLVMATVIIVPFIAQYAPPVPPSDWARNIYDAVEALPPGSTVLFSGDYDPGSEAEIYPMNLALFHHLGQKDVKVIVTQLWPQGPPLVEKAMRETFFPHGKEYGKDIVNLGYKTGGQILIKSLVASIPKVFPTDINGTPVEKIPVMKGVNSLRDIDLMIILSAGTPGTKEWVQQAQSRLGTPMASGVTAVSAPDFFAYVNSGQLIGLLGGLRGAADYEVLVNRPGRGVLGMGPQSTGHMLIVVFIVLGNIGFLLARRKSRRA